MKEHSIHPAIGRNSRTAPERIPDDVLRAVVDEFAEHGLTFSEKAVRFCWDAWKRDFKSGYRDNASGTHLFAPCGCNALGLYASELVPGEEHWQKTYAV